MRVKHFYNTLVKQFYTGLEKYVKFQGIYILVTIPSKILSSVFSYRKLKDNQM